LATSIDDNDLLGLNPLSLTYEDAVNKRAYIRRLNKTRTYLFNENIVWSPIVGSDKVRGDQLKWESKCSEYILNSNLVSRGKI